MYFDLFIFIFMLNLAIHTEKRRVLISHIAMFCQVSWPKGNLVGLSFFAEVSDLV